MTRQHLRNARDSALTFRRSDVELADQERSIVVAAKSQEQSVAQAKAEEARAKATSATESVETARKVAIAERDRQTAVIMARQQAEQEATKITVSAEAEQAAANNRAQAIKVAAQAEADAATIKAEAQAKTYAVEADGQRKINEARNAMSAAVIELEITKERLRIIPLALAEAVRPLEKIGEVRIIDLGGGGAGAALAGGNGHGAGAGNGGHSDGLVDALLAYRAQSPVIDSLLKEAGFTTEGNPITTLISASNAKPNGAAVPSETEKGKKN